MTSCIHLEGMQTDERTHARTHARTVALANIMPAPRMVSEGLKSDVVRDLSVDCVLYSF